MSGPEALRPLLPAEHRVRADWHRPGFRPYRWRDPARVTPEHAAELAAMDAAEGVCSCCGNAPSFCDRRRR